MKNIKLDKLIIAMQDEAIKIASERLGHQLSKELGEIIRNPRWSYMGLEMIIDTVRTVEISELQGYISRLEWKNGE